MIFGMQMDSCNYALFIIFIYHLQQIIFIQSSYVPDEYWQALEVAHQQVFGYGYLTWEWKKRIRSCAYPGMISCLYCLLKWLNLDFTLALIHFPRIFQSALSCCADYSTLKLSQKLFGKKVAKWTLFSISTSWFIHYCGPRTLTNGAESAFTACGLYLYPWSYYKRKSHNLSYLWLAGLSCIMRPTAAIIWTPLYIWHTWRERKYIVCIIIKSLVIGFFVIGITIMIDFWCFRAFVVTPYQFFIFNWKNDIGAFYGSHPWHWYFSIGFPIIMAVHLVPFLLGMKMRKLRPLYLLILCFIIILSQLSHKEFRFLLPLMHLSMIVCGTTLSELATNGIKVWKVELHKTTCWLIAFATLIIELPLTSYMGLYHQRGTLDAIDYLSTTITDDSDILFLMPCHSTPYYSHIHRNVSMKFLTCEPNFDNKENYVDEADEFYGDPSEWLNVQYKSKLSDNNIHQHLRKLPTHIVIFDNLYNEISNFLSNNRYELCFSAFHAHFSQGRVGQHVNVFCRFL